MYFFILKLEVKFRTRFLCQLVANALRFCKNNLKEFSEAEPTIKCIQMFNAGFDILNTKSKYGKGNQKALCVQNFKHISEFSRNFTTYIQGLKWKEGNRLISVLESSRKEGFLGFIIGFNSLLHIYYSLINLNKLNYFKLHTISQEQIHFFF